MKNHSLTQGSIAKGLLFFVIPLFFSNLFQQLYNTIDTLLVGHFLGDNALAAMGATAAIFELIVQFSNGCGTGFSIVTARYYGSKNENELKKSVAASLILGLIISIVITIVSYVSMPYLLTILKTPKSIYHDSLNYIRCISAFLIITMFYNLGAGMLRAIGDSLRPLIVLFCSSIINIALDILSEANIFIDDTPGISIMEIKNKCRRIKAEHELDLIVLDYLQLMSYEGKTDSRQQEISALSRHLKLLAREMDCPVIVLSQLSRAPEQRTDHRPQLSDLRESGAIEQDADIVLFLYRDDYYEKENSEKPGVCEVIIAKQRSGPTGTVELMWLEKYTRFADKSNLLL